MSVLDRCRLIAQFAVPKARHVIIVDLANVPQFFTYMDALDFHARATIAARALVVPFVEPRGVLRDGKWRNTDYSLALAQRHRFAPVVVEGNANAADCTMSWFLLLTSQYSLSTGGGRSTTKVHLVTGDQRLAAAMVSLYGTHLPLWHWGSRHREFKACEELVRHLSERTDTPSEQMQSK